MFSQDDLIELIREKVLVSNNERLIIRNDKETEGGYLFDFRKLLLSPDHLRGILERFMVELSTYSDIQIGGIESAALPLITGLTLMKGVPGFYMRKSRKKTGLLNFFEGNIDPKKPVILVDDILNSGYSILKQIQALEKEGIQVEAVCAILRYHPEEWYQELMRRNIKIHSLITHDEIAELLGISTLSHDEIDISTGMSIIPQARFAVENPRYNILSPRPTPFFDGKILYTPMDDGTVYALDPSTFEIIWQFETTFGSKGKRILSSCTGNGKSIFFGAYDGNFYALDALTGKCIWKDETADWIGSSPCYIEVNNTVCVGMEYAGKIEQGGYTLFDASTGEIQWTVSSPKYTHGSPIFSEKYSSIFGGSNDGLFYRIDLHTGTILWMFSASAEIKGKPILTADEEYIIFGAFDGVLYVLETKSGKEVFRYVSKAAIYSTPCVEENTIYFSSLDKNIYAVDFQKKSELWVYSTAGRVFASPVVHGGALYCGSNDGDLHILALQDGKLLKRWIGIERIMTPAVFINDHNFVIRTIANELYLF